MKQKMVLNIDDKAYKNAEKFAKKKGTTVEKLAIDFIKDAVEKNPVIKRRKGIKYD